MKAPLRRSGRGLKKVLKCLSNNDTYNDKRIIKVNNNKLKVMKTLITIVLTCCMLNVLMAQSYSENVRQEIAFETIASGNVFYLANINGGIKVEGYDGEKIILEARKEVKAKTEERLQKSRTELSIGIIDRHDTIVVYVKGACGAFDNRGRRAKKDNGRWNYHWNNCEYDYDFKYDFTLKVPKNMNLYLSTINEGNVEVKDVSGSLVVNNVNGAISLSQIAGLAKVHTINGDVTLEYQDLPKEASSYYTLNGDINAMFPKGLKADMTFKSFNGDFYTNIEKLEYKQAMVEKNETGKAGGLAYKVDSRSAISVGGGGVALDFETFNGDVFVKEQQ